MYIERLDLKKKFFDSLNEADRRRFAALEALNLGRGGVGVVSEFFEISIKTIHQGLIELESEEALLTGRIRRPGGGRKKKLSTSQD